MCLVGDEVHEALARGVRDEREDLRRRRERLPRVSTSSQGMGGLSEHKTHFDVAL